MSTAVTEPYNWSVSPTRRAIEISMQPKARGHGFRLPLLFGLARLHDLPLALDVLLVALGRQQRQLPRQQVVARVAVGDLDDLAAACPGYRRVL